MAAPPGRGRGRERALGPNVPAAGLPPRAAVVLLGDSLTQRGGAVTGGAPGWAARLGEFYTRRADVVNRGLSGYNTRWVRQDLPVLLGGAAGAGAAFVVVWLGANDAALPGGDSAAQHVPLAEYEDNLRAIIRHVKALPGGAGLESPEVLVVAPPPVDEEARLRFTGGAAPERTNAAAKAYAQACMDVARDCRQDPITRGRVWDLDLWNMFMERGQPGASILGPVGTGPGGPVGHGTCWKELLSDGLHLSPLGEEFVYNAIALRLKSIEEMMQRGQLSGETMQGKLTPASLPMDVPDWTDLVDK